MHFIQKFLGQNPNSIADVHSHQHLRMKYVFMYSLIVRLRSWCVRRLNVPFCVLSTVHKYVCVHLVVCGLAINL